MNTHSGGTARFTLRPLSECERAVLDRLLSVEFDGVEGYRAQLDAITVTGQCACGCETVVLEVD